MGAMRRVALGALLLACALFMVTGVELWSTVTSDVYTTERVPSPECGNAVSPGFTARACPLVYETVATGSRPNHVPAVWALLLGGAAGALGLVVFRPHKAASMHRRFESSAN